MKKLVSGTPLPLFSSHNLAHKRQGESQIVGFELSFRDCGLTRISPSHKHSSGPDTNADKLIINLSVWTPIANQPHAESN